MCASMRKDSANTDEIPIFATSSPSLQCMKCKPFNVVFLLKWKRGDYIQAMVSIAFFLYYLKQYSLWHGQPKTHTKMICNCCQHTSSATVLPAKSGSDVMSCLQGYHGLRIDRSY